MTCNGNNTTHHNNDTNNNKGEGVAGATTNSLAHPAASSYEYTSLAEADRMRMRKASVLHHTILYYTILYYTISYHNTPYYTII